MKGVEGVEGVEILEGGVGWDGNGRVWLSGWDGGVVEVGGRRGENSGGGGGGEVVPYIYLHAGLISSTYKKTKIDDGEDSHFFSFKVSSEATTVSLKEPSL